MKKFIYPLFALLLLLVLACKKQNEIYPDLSLLEPYQNQSFDFGDTIFIKLTCTNCEGLPEVHLLYGATIVGLSKYIATGNDGSLNFQIILNEPNLQSGQYTVRAIGYNGANSSADFQNINYKALERELVGISLLSGSSGSTTIGQFNFGSPIVYQALGYKARLLSSNSRQKTLVSASASTGMLLGLSQGDLTQKYQLPNPSLPGLGQYQVLFSHDDLVFVFQYDGEVLAINGAGQTQRSYSLPQNKIAVCASMGDAGMLVGSKEEVGQNYMLHLLNPQNGFVVKQVAIPGQALSMCYVGSHLYHLLYKKAGNMYLAEYNSESNKFTTITNIGNEKANVIVGLGQAKSIIATENKILVYDPQQTTMPTELYGFGATDVQYNTLNQDLYLAIGTQVLVGKLGAVPNQIINAADSIFKIALVYNY